VGGSPISPLLTYEEVRKNMAKPKGAQASKLLTAGSYEYELAYASPTVAGGSNAVVAYVATAECLLTWVRMHLDLCFLTPDTSTACARPITLVCVKQDATSTLPDITDGDVVELLRRDGKLFFLKHVMLPGYLSGRGITWETEFRNVKLRIGERLVWGYWNHTAAIATAGWLAEKSVLEYRLVSV
jgi:hypothetical protein